MCSISRYVDTRIHISVVQAARKEEQVHEYMWWDNGNVCVVYAKDRNLHDTECKKKILSPQLSFSF